MKVFWLCLFVLIGSISPSAFSQTENLPPRFHTELANTGAHDAALSRLQVYVSVPHGELAFSSTTEGLQAEYQIAIAVTDNKGASAATRLDKIALHGATEQDTRSRSKYAFHSYTFDLPPGVYTTQITLTDLVRNVQASVAGTKALRNFNPTQTRLAISDLIWLERETAQAAGFTPTLFENTTPPNRELALYLEIHSSDLTAPVHVQQSIRNARKEIVFEQRRVWPRRSRVEKLALPLNTETLPFGSYEVEMLIQQGRVTIKGFADFRLAWHDIPATALHLNEALGAALYLASDSESVALQAALKQLPLANKREALKKFWQHHKYLAAITAREAMASFYARIVEANDKFGGDKPGWQTDLGRVYLTQGPPDEIEMPTQAAAKQPFQIWRYRLGNREFLFVDRKGLGVYQLASAVD